MPERPAEGLFGWTRLGCVTFLLTVLPIWLGLTGAFVYLWGDDWHDRMGFAEGARLLGIELVWYVSLVQGALMVGLIAGLASLVVAGMRAVERYASWRSHRDASRRYEDLVGDGAVLRSDAWNTDETPTDETPADETPTDEAFPGPEAAPEPGRDDASEEGTATPVAPPSDGSAGDREGSR